MKTSTRRIFLLLAATLLAGPILFLPSTSVLADPISVTIQRPGVVFFVVVNGLSRWADDPLGTCTGTSDNQCCTGSTINNDCKNIAARIRISPEHYTRRIYTCLADKTNWKCDTFITSDKEKGMYCETVPPLDDVLADVATCVSAEAQL